MRFKVTIEPEAEYELHHAASWWRKHRSAKQAREWLLAFDEAIAKLELNPKQNALAHESSRFQFKVYQLNFGLGRSKTHRALYRIHGQEVVVISVRHLAQDDLSP